MKTLLFFVSLMLVLSISVWAQSASDNTLIKSGDTLTVSIFDVADLTVTVLVQSDGKVRMPLLNSVPADGLTIGEFRRIVEERLAAFVQKPRITVQVRQR